MEENRTPEETEAKKEALEKKKKAHRKLSSARRALKIGAIAAIGFLGKPSESEAQGWHIERINTTQQQAPQRTQQQAPQQIIYGSVEWIENQGYIRSSRLSEGLNRRGQLNDDNTWRHRGYKGVWIEPNSGRACLIPNDPIEDRDLVDFSSIKDLKDDQHYERGPYAPSNVRGAYPSRGYRVYRHRGWRY